MDAPIEIVEADAEWADAFLRERDIIVAALSGWLVGLPEHVGSTAVRGLPAKPVIDIMAPVRSLAAAVPAIEMARGIGYVYFPYKVEAMHWFCKPSPAVRTHHLYLVEAGSDAWADRIAFRDALRGSAELRSRYESLKRDLAAKYRNDREAYTDGKAPFIEEVLRASRCRLARHPKEESR